MMSGIEGAPGGGASLPEGSEGDHLVYSGGLWLPASLASVKASLALTAADVAVTPSGDLVATDAQTGLENATLLAVAAQADIASHIINASNPHNVTKSQVGLGNVDNTSDANKPVSTAQAAALAGKAASSHTHVIADVPAAAFTVEEVALAADQTNVRFPASGNLPTGYAAWELLINGRMTDAAAASEPYLQFNGDTGSNYDYMIAAQGSTNPTPSGSYAQTAFRLGSIPSASNAQANLAGGVRAMIFDPEGPFWKSIHAVENLRSVDTAGLYRYEQAGDWKSTAAITSILITGNFKAGSRFTLVGIKKATTPRTT